MFPNTAKLITCIELDLLPDYATMVDFGLDHGDPTEKFGALQWAYRRELVTAEELDLALGNGPKLTEIAARTSEAYGANPYYCVFTTAWDEFPIAHLWKEED